MLTKQEIIRHSHNTPAKDCRFARSLVKRAVETGEDLAFISSGCF